ncbi:MAG: hypothetical protein NTW65_05170 [Deltaproteobacteria bacterium]|nr:hypothetical protein [Deltaproteobacteria bacterium]
MLINCKQTRAKFFFPHKIILVLLAVAAVFLVLPASVSAPTKLPAKVLSDQELSEVSAQSFFTLTELDGTAGCPGTSCRGGSPNVIRLDLGVNLVMNAHVESFKMGYYDNGATGIGMDSDGWDMDVVNYFWGGNDYTSGIPATPLAWNGVFLEFGFDNITSNTNRVLNYIELGTAHATGQITGSILTMNGMFASAGTGQNGGVLLRQTAAGVRTIDFSDEILTFVFASKYSYHSSTGLRGIFNKIPNYSAT